MMCHVTASRTVLLGAKPWGGEEGLEEGNSQQWQNWPHHLQGLLQNPKHGVTCLNIIKNFKAVTEGIKPNIGPFQVDPHWYFETYPQHIYKWRDICKMRPARLGYMCSTLHRGSVNSELWNIPDRGMGGNRQRTSRGKVLGV